MDGVADGTAFQPVNRPEGMFLSVDLEESPDDRSVVARVAGPLDLEHAAAFLRWVEPLCAAPRRVVLDLCDVDFVDSAGVRALMHLRERVEAAQGEMVLVVAPGSRVRRTLGLLQLESTFRMEECLPQQGGRSVAPRAAA